MNSGDKISIFIFSREEESYRSKNAPKVGKYSVDVKSFESIALPILNVIVD
jgi:hypothetical protein